MAGENVRRVLPSDSSRNGKPESPVAPSTGGLWFPPYVDALARSGLSETARRVIKQDVRYIVDQCVLGAGAPSDAEHAWPESRLRRGLVIGSVQSGKTASMLGVTAHAIDQGADIVVLLTGTRTALWRQTAERALAQLDGWTPHRDGALRTRRVMIPNPTLIYQQRGKPDLKDLYFATPNLVRRHLSKRRPVIALVMKQAQHLMRFGAYLRDTLATAFDHMGRPLHLLVIDDEADDGSILDAVVENSLAPDSDAYKQIPRHIAQIWAGAGANHVTFDDRLFATYMAYTATPQANFLQADHNPLAPSDFVVALRTPLDSGTAEPPRSTTYQEPSGLAGYYIGGEIYYRRLAEGPGALLCPRVFPDRSEFHDTADFQQAVELQRREMLGDAMRAYFVAAALHLRRQDKSIAAARALGATSPEALQAVCPKPLSALVHPSARRDEHFRVAEQIAAWSAGLDFDSLEPDEVPRDEFGSPCLDPSGLARRLEDEEPRWRQWLASYDQTRERLTYLPGGDTDDVTSDSEWEGLRRILRDEVFPNVRLVVINSDPDADDRPRFDPTPEDDEAVSAPIDILSIFVSGNVMSRGLTIEGLVTTLFLRSADHPAADTQMQMQRWFGYRGTYLRWCRVFLYEDQRDLFRAYHEADEAQRREVIEEMNTNPSAPPTPMVLQGSAFRATGKIANIRSLPLCPGADPFVTVIEHGKHSPANAAILAALLATESWDELKVAGLARGQVMRRRLTLNEVASLLDSFRYSHHDPDPTLPQHDRWRSWTSSLGLDTPLFRPSGHLESQAEAVTPPHCPYSIAAYLRLWSTVLTRRVKGLYPTDDRQTPWSMIDLETYRDEAPHFVVGVRYGDRVNGICSEAGLENHGIYRMERRTIDGVAVSRWGSRNPGAGDGAYLGDQLFDYHVHGRRHPAPVPGEPIWRPRGDPGLVLFHVLKPEDPNEPDAVTVGLGLPLGGPDQFAALRPPMPATGP